LLHFYLKAMLFKRLEKILKQGEKLTEGARKSADVSLAEVERKTAKHEATPRDARADLYRQHGSAGTQVAGVRSEMEAAVKQAKEQIAAEAPRAPGCRPRRTRWRTFPMKRLR
jgi:hypothetical protein